MSHGEKTKSHRRNIMSKVLLLGDTREAFTIGSGSPGNNLYYLKLFYNDNFFKLTILLFQATKDAEVENIMTKCAKVFEQTFTRNFRTGILNSCSGFRLG